MESDRVPWLAWCTTVALFLSCRTVSSDQPAYIMSSSAKCPTGSSHLQSLADCQSAAELLFLSDDTPVQESRSAWPMGCFRRDTADLYFNPAGSEDSTAFVVRVLCSWVEPTTVTTLTTSSTIATSSAAAGDSTTTTGTPSTTAAVESTTTIGTPSTTAAADSTTTIGTTSTTAAVESTTTIGTPSTTAAADSTTTIGTPPPEDGLGYRGSCKTSINLNDPDNIFMPERNTSLSIPSIPATFDARDQWPHCFADVSVPVQGGCGSCWAFAPAAVTRHRACIYDCEKNSRCDSSNVMYGRHLSVQQILGCGSERAGCDGGWAYQAYDAMKERLTWSVDVPYQCEHGNVVDQFNADAGSCVRWPWNTADYPQACSLGNDHVSVIGHYRLPLHNAGQNAAAVMAAELATNGPLAVDFCIRNNFFGFWSSDKTRIYTDADGCKHGDVVGGHMATMVGFNALNGLQYWILQNSWSDAWAHDGFFYMQRGVNLCGIENKASAADVRVSAATVTFTTITTTLTTATTMITTSGSSATTVTIATTTGSSVISQQQTTFSTTSMTTNTFSTTSMTTNTVEVLWPGVIPGLRGTTTTTTTPTIIEVILQAVTESSSEEANGVPWLPFWIIMSTMLLFIGGLAVTAAVLWSRHATLRKSLRSQRPGLIPGNRASWSGSRLRENPDALTPTNSGDSPQLMGVCTGVPVTGNVTETHPVTGHVTASPHVHPQGTSTNPQELRKL